MRRCPASIVTPDVWKLMDAYAAFDAHGVLPIDGGWENQSRCFVRWTRVIGAERARIEEERRPRKHAPSVPSGD